MQRRGDWPQWRYDLRALAQRLAEVSRAQGLLLGRLADVGLALRDQASLAALTEDVVKTSEIEGERLDAQSVSGTRGDARVGDARVRPLLFSPTPRCGESIAHSSHFLR